MKDDACYTVYLPCQLEVLLSAMGGLDDAVPTVEAGDKDHAQAVHVAARGARTFVLNLRG